MNDNNQTVVKRGNIEDEETQEAYEVFEFHTVSNKVRQLRIPRAKSRDALYIYSELLRHNANLAFWERDAIATVQEAIDSQVSAQFTYAKGLGWRKHQNGFVFANAVVGGVGVKRNVLPPLWASNREAAVLCCKGDVNGWRNGVGNRCECSDSLMLVIAACLAAPLLKVFGLPNFGINLFGLESEDRVVLVGIAASVLGLGDGFDLLAMGRTNGGRPLEDARGFNDLLYIVPDAEIGSLAAYRRQRGYIGELIIGRARPASSNLRAKQPALGWRGVFLATHSNSMEDVAARLSEGRTNEERVACIDVPASFADPCGKSSSTMSHQRLKNWGPGRREALRAASAAQQGTPIRAYIAFLIDHRATLKRGIRKHMAAFAANCAELRLAKSHIGTAQNFAVMYAGGCLAIEAGILPWTRKRLQNALQNQLAEVIAHLRNRQISPATIRRILRRRLRSSTVVCLKPGMRFGPEKAAGFQRKSGGKIVFTVHAKAFRQWFGRASQWRAALLWLHKSGLLELGDRQALPSVKSTEWAERTPRWPDGSVQRSFIFRVPSPVSRYIRRTPTVTSRSSTRLVETKLSCKQPL